MSTFIILWNIGWRKKIYLFTLDLIQERVSDNQDLKRGLKNQQCPWKIRNPLLKNENGKISQHVYLNLEGKNTNELSTIVYVKTKAINIGSLLQHKLMSGEILKGVNRIVTDLKNTVFIFASSRHVNLRPFQNIILKQQASKYKHYRKCVDKEEG